jgi:hypothetical protein
MKDYIETERIKAILLEHHPGSKIVHDVTCAKYYNGVLTISFKDGKTWLYMIDANGKLSVYQQKGEYHRDSMRSVLRDLKLNELTDECEL